jgi:hypothetical protein
MVAPQLAGSALEGTFIKYYKCFSDSRVFECSNRLCEKFTAAAARSKGAVRGFNAVAFVHMPENVTQFAEG